MRRLLTLGAAAYLIRWAYNYGQLMKAREVEDWLACM